VPENEENNDESESSRRQSAGIEVRWRKAGFDGPYGAHARSAGDGGPETGRGCGRACAKAAGDGYGRHPQS
jgi:hypothetical protein